MIRGYRGRVGTVVRLDPELEEGEGPMPVVRFDGDGINHLRYVSEDSMQLSGREPQLDPASARPRRRGLDDEELSTSVRLAASLREVLGLARALEKQTGRGVSSRRGGAIFARAEAALRSSEKTR
jgi:hypothetical protein